jgi:DNA-binding transcriptional LysR family regulator
MRTRERGARRRRLCPDANGALLGSDLPAGLLSQTFHNVLVVAETGSFSAAARLIGVRQSTVSRQVRELEDSVGVSLFERHGAGTRPTDAGRQFLARLSQVRGLARTAVGEARDFGAVRTGRLRLGFVGSFASPPAKEILGRLRGLHPGLQIHLAELGATELIHKVRSHDLDCAWVPSWRSPDPALAFEPLWSEPLYLAMPAAQPGADSVVWADLSGRILLARPEAELDLLFRVLEQAGVSPPEVRFHDLSRESFVALVAEGEGVAILPESFACIGRPGVRFARIAESSAETTVCVTYRRDRDNPALRRLLAVTRDWRRETRPTPESPSGPA